ncbi:MAG: transcription termination/antitermination factor NusG [Synergistaceae bacterium]|nr:transcription termination/antitermination factor NusG [Synergistaceae bacterium]
MPDKERRWYVVQTYASYEKRVEADLRQRIEAMNMQDKIFNVLIPTETHIEVKDGKSREVTRKLYPSYVMVEMILDEQSWYAVRHTPGVTGFIGAGTHPMPLSQEEVDRIMAGMRDSRENMKVEMDLKPGDSVRVIAEGEMKGFTGPVVEVNAKKGRVRFKSDVLGGAVLETDYKALEKI